MESLKEEIPKIKKRGRKAKSVNFKNNKDVFINNFELEETFILHLPISIDKLVNSVKNIQKQTIESILSEKPRDFLYHSNSNNNDDNSENDKFITSCNTEKKYQQYTETNSKGENEIIKVYEASFLDYEKDYENIKRVKIAKTKIACWWCCHQFDTYPVCSPLKYDGKKDIFTVIGCFCSFNCSKSFSMTEYNCRYELNSYLYKRIMKQYKDIKKAPCKSVLKMFGGPLSINEYRETFDTLSEVKINKYPMVYMPNQIQYKKVDNNFKNLSKKPTTNTKSKNYLNDKKIQEAVKRKTIDKTTNKKNNSSVLMDMMGIKYKTTVTEE